MKGKNRRGVLVGIVSSIFVLILVFADPSTFRSINQFLYDRFFAWRASSPQFMEKEARNDIVIFYIDKLTLRYANDHFKESFPWPRSRYTRILSDLHNAGAKAIGLDLLFPDSRPGDEELAKEAQESRTVAASRFVYGHDVLQDYEPTALSKRGNAASGFADIIPDQDQVVRQSIVHLNTRFSDNPWSFELTLLQNGLQIPAAIQNDSLLIQNRHYPLVNEKFFERNKGAAKGAFLRSFLYPIFSYSVTINYGARNPFIHYPLYTLWNEEKSGRLKAVQGKIVLIGANAAEAGEIFGSDQFATPLGPMNGVEIRAQTLKMLLDGRAVRDVLKSPVGLIVLVLVIGIVYGSVFRFKGWSRFAIGLSLIALEIGGAYLLFLRLSIRFQLSTVLLASIVDFGSLSFYTYLSVKREIESIRRLFEGYLSPDVVSNLIESENRSKIRKQLAGQKQPATILYADIRGFTEISEQLPPEKVVELLNEYFAPMTKVIYDHGGYLDKIIGDAVMAVFSAPFPKPDDPWRAVSAAIEMQKQSSEIGLIWEKERKPKFQIGIGINTGFVVLGNVGSSYKKDYTVIGDAVNISARLCAAAKGGEILISEDTFLAVKEKIKTAASLGPLAVKGKKIPIQTYSVSL